MAESYKTRLSPTVINRASHVSVFSSVGASRQFTTVFFTTITTTTTTTSISSTSTAALSRNRGSLP